ncbi:hypothetical protein KP803_00480 [Vibrio sp. ZSDE26]|uniref:Uncharacterized protein n=1 Tax=Vibrio amylolyticus TaxID=2847292 RepID=A0A9X2BHW0_9VIBR|nr:hypothetical protein [Vibrio amylolyticus]MCK6261742.1 hypothetical protein [Vibrio amylolyticus]
MSDQNVGQILQAFNSIESKLQEQNGMIRELTAKVGLLENQNKKLEQMMLKMKPAQNSSTDQLGNNGEFQDKVTQSLKSIEDKSKKAIELIKVNGSGVKKRAWP